MVPTSGATRGPGATWRELLLVGLERVTGIEPAEFSLATRSLTLRGHPQKNVRCDSPVVEPKHEEKALLGAVLFVCVLVLHLLHVLL